MGLIIYGHRISMDRILSGKNRDFLYKYSMAYTYTAQNISIQKGGRNYEVVQYHFTSWPDHGVPEYAGPILNYLRRIKAQHKPSKGPILVHCR